MELENIPCQQQADNQRQGGGGCSHQKQTDTYVVEACTKLGPAEMPTTAMNMFRPTLFNTHCEGSGMRPKVGCLLRSQPKNKPAINAPPLVLKPDGDAADMDGKCSEQTSDKDTKAYEYHIRSGW